MKIRLFGMMWAALIGVSPPYAAASDDAPELLTRTKHYSSTYTVQEDGTYILEREWASTVLKEQALASSKQTSISYSTSVEKSEVLAAYTQKSNGEKIEAPPSNFQIEANSGKDNASAAFSDRTTLTVIFPDVAIGDTVVLKYRITTNEPIFPKQISIMETFYKSWAMDSALIKIDAPASLVAQFQVKDLKEVQNVEKDGRRILEWRWENKEPIKSGRDNFSVFDREQEAGFSYSTFKTYQDIAESYGLRARPKAAVTERIQKLANGITKGKKAPKAIAHALYDWVTTNISYAGNCIGIGAVVPRDLDFVVGNKMGDCKDHATLLQALLAAKGIASTQALINSGNSYKLQKVPVVAMVNHVINYVPAWDIYLDSTSESTPFGMLPLSAADKPVLLVDGYKDGTRTPKIAPTENQQVMKTTIKIGADGSAKGSAFVDVKGHLAVSSRDYFRSLSKATEADLVKFQFKYAGYEAKGSVSRDDPKPLLGEHRYSTTFDVQDMFNLDGPSAFTIGPMVFSQRSVAAYAASANEQLEETELVTCMGGRAIEEYVYELPKDVKLTAIPPNLKLGSGPYSYTASYKRIGRRLIVKREFDDRTQGNVCSAKDASLHKQFAEKVLRNLRAQVIVQPRT